MQVYIREKPYQLRASAGSVVGLLELGWVVGWVVRSDRQPVLLLALEI